MVASMAKPFALKTTLLSTLHLFTTASAAQEEFALPDNWRISPAGNSIKYTAHGTKVYGHELGFIKRKGSCELDNLWISWSTTADGVEAMQGVTGGFNIVTGDQSGRVALELVLARKAFINSSVLYFTNMIAGEVLIREMRRERVVKVSVISPVELVEMLDIREDEFDVSGFVEVRKEVERMCERLESVG